MNFNIDVSIAKGSLSASFLAFLKLGSAPWQERHASRVRVGACIDRIYELFNQQGSTDPLLSTQLVWNEVIESKIKDPSDVAFYKDEMISFHNYYYETLRSDDE